MAGESFEERSGRPTIHLAASGGGHVDLLMAVRDSLTDFRCVWLLQPSRRVDSLRAEGEEVVVFPDYDRNPRRGHHLANVRFSLDFVRRHRPRLVVTSGAGVTVPFTAAARAAGAKVVFIETMARVYDGSASGRVLSRLAHRTLVQWPQLQQVYRGARLCQPALLDGVGSSPAGQGSGTFVGVGTHNQPFDRLLALVDEAIGDGVLPRPAIVQSGVARYEPRNFVSRAWLLPDEVNEAVAAAAFVICHAGSGIISTALRNGRRPLVLARRRDHGEHFDDHQEQLVQRLGELGLVIPLEDRITPQHIEAAMEPLPEDGDWRQGPSLGDALLSELGSLIGEGLSRPLSITTA